MSLDHALKIAKECADMEVKSAFLAGGEPLLFDGIDQLVNALLAGDIFPFLSTNGVALNRRHIDSFVTAGLDFFQISLDAASPKIFKIMSGGSDAFDRVASNVNYAVRKGISIRLKSVLTPHNYRETPIILERFGNVGVNEFEIVPAHPSVDGRSEQDTLVLHHTELDEVQKFIDASPFREKVRLGNAMKPWGEKKPKRTCGGAISSVVFFPNGNSGICDMMQSDEEFQLGNVVTGSVAEMWNSERAQWFRKIPQVRYAEECRTCEFRIECRSGCFNLSKMAYGEAFAPDPGCPVRQQQHAL